MQFISVAQCNADVGVMNQDDYCQSNPLMMVPCYVSGDALPVGNASDADALVAFLIAVLAVLARLPV